MRDDNEKKPHYFIWSNPVSPSWVWDRWMDDDGIIHRGRQPSAAKDDADFQRFMAKAING